MAPPSLGVSLREAGRVKKTGGLLLAHPPSRSNFGPAMPTYDYACENCGHKWDVEQRMSEDPIRKCPKCGKLKAKRQITGGNFILKGGGWYSDLYSSSSKSTKT